MSLGMGKIVAIGGGSMELLETLPIDRRIVRLTGRKRPRALFIPTASTDAASYVEIFNAVYGQRLRCDIGVLRLILDRYSKNELRRRILSADLIYVGGGNTLKMMRRWRTLGVNRLLRIAHRKGIVVSGLSAGCICWFNYGHSDSMAFYHPDDWNYVRVRGVGFIGATGCPHYDAERRDRDFESMIRRTGDVGIALDNNCALEVIDHTYRVIRSSTGAGAYRVKKVGKEIVTERIPARAAHRPLRSLLDLSENLQEIRRRSGE